MERAVSGTGSSPTGIVSEGSRGRLLLLFADTPSEEGLLREWLLRSGDHAPVVHAGEGELEAALQDSDATDAEVIPVRVIWLAPERRGMRQARMRDVLTLRDPRRPAASAQRRLVTQQPDRYQVLVGESASVSELRRRFASRNGERFEVFVERQGVLALERAERAIIGDRYKVPRLVREDLMATARFQAMIARLAAEHDRDPSDVKRESTAALDEMVASQSRLAIDAWDHFGRWVSRAYKLDVDTAGLDELRRLNERHTLVFLPSHRSYMDTLVLRPVLHGLGFPPNHVLGGANLDFWPIGPVSRRNGYVFIRRTMKGAEIYKAVLREYLAYLLRKRFNLEWYLEGGRSRTGKLRPPRYGILNYVVEAFREGGIDDVMLVPVAVVYDQLHEVSAMAAEERGAAKQAEGLKWIVNYTRAQGRQFGAVHVRFAEPVSLRAALAEGGATVPKVAFEVLNRVNRVTPITGTALVAFAALGGENRAVTFEEGRALMRPVLDYIDARGLPTVEGIGHGKTAVVSGAVQRLVREGVVEEYAGGTEPVYRVADGKHVEAAFYRNNVVHHFLTRAITELAVLHAAEQDSADPAEDAWQEALRLRDLLKFEFFFPRKRLFADDVRTEATILLPGWEERHFAPAEVRAVLQQAPVLLAPRVLESFVEAYLVVADHLAGSDPSEAIDRDTFLRECIGIGRQLVLMGRLHAPESVSRELYAGALKLAENRGLLAEPGGEQVREQRAVMAAQLRGVARRLDELRALSAGNGS